MSFKITLVQFNPVVGNPLHNAQRMLAFIKTAASEGSQLVVFPELVLEHYHAQDLLLNQALQNDVEAAVVLIRAEARRLKLSVLFGHSSRNPHFGKGQKALFNTASLLGSVFPEVSRAKTLLPTYREFMEDRWFEQGDLNDIKPVKPVDAAGPSLGFIICEEGWNHPIGHSQKLERIYAIDPIDFLAHTYANLDMIINISASPGYSGKLTQVLNMNSKIAQEYKLPMAWVNTLGFQDQLGFWGGTHVFNSRGQLVALLPQDHEAHITVDLAQLDSMPAIADWQEARGSELGLMRELDAALGMYLKDYFRKSGLSKFWPIKTASSDSNANTVLDGLRDHWDKISEGGVVLGISGGIDSSVVATAAVKHLGAVNVLGVWMPSRFNSAEEKNLALSLAKNLGITLLIEPIEDVVAQLTHQWNIPAESLTHENIQARLRAIILWSIANRKNKTVLNTTNWTEAAMGYGTIGGDLLGLPLIASLPKTWVYRLARYYHTLGEAAISQAHLDIVPTAALRSQQSDEVSFGARYWLLDMILEDLFMDYGDVAKTKQKFLGDAAFLETYQPLDGSSNKLASLEAVIDRCAKALLQNTEFKRGYYNRTPQFTPFSWLRWQWPMANTYFSQPTPL